MCSESLKIFLLCSLKMSRGHISGSLPALRQPQVDDREDSHDGAGAHQVLRCEDDEGLRVLNRSQHK